MFKNAKITEAQVKPKYMGKREKETSSGRPFERTTKKRSYRPYGRNRFKEFMVYVVVVIIIPMCSIKVYDFFTSHKTNHIESTTLLKQDMPATETPNHFECDGRIYCTQMNSREEARFFADHCPGTKMRSTPGEPCKNDSRW